MTERISARQFLESDGVDDWRVLYGGACAYFRTGSFAKGVALVDRIGALADAANHHPDVDLRYPGVTVRLITHDVGGLSDRDVALARQVSAAARELGVEADPAAAQTVQFVVDAGPGVIGFWRAVLAYKDFGDEAITDPHGRNPSIWFQGIDAPRPQRNTIHVDVSVPHDQAEARVAAALAAGGRLVSDEHAPDWWTLADAEGNEVDVVSMLNRN
jgi:4a-hydroxytetrahydrobiopterin dehydratase